MSGRPNTNELRIHGVGGDAPHAVLGMPHPNDAIPSWSTGGGRVAVFTRRTHPSSTDHPRQVFAWGELTSGSRWFALWTLLLPFTLVNLGGWMHPATDNRGLVKVIRWLVFLAGLLLTGSTVAWLALAGAIHLPLWWGLAAAGGAMVIVIATATIVSGRFESFRPPGFVSTAKDRPIGDPGPYLDDPAFFDNGKLHKARWWVHLVAAVMVAATVIALVADGSEREAASDIGKLILKFTAAQLVVVAALAVVSFRRVVGVESVRWSGPALAVGAGMLVSGGLASGALVAVAGGVKKLDANAAFVAMEAYGVAAAAAAVVALITALLVLSRAAPAEATDPLGPPHEQLLRGGSARLRARLAQLPRHLDLVLVALVGAFLVGFAVLVIARRHDLAGHQPDANLLTRLTLVFLGVFVAKLLRDISRNFMSRESRRGVGVLWDVMTFWPRSFHPFAVRPYAERAVPELRAFLETGGDDPLPARWVITAHSQGSVIAYAALRPAITTPPIDLMTFGSPLAGLYAKAFPAYFAIDDFRAHRVKQDKNGSWVNYFRATDPVGREVFTRVWASRNKRVDVGLQDPNPTTPEVELGVPDLEQDPPTDGMIWAHNGFRRAHHFKSAVTERLRRSGP